MCADRRLAAQPTCCQTLQGAGSAAHPLCQHLLRPCHCCLPAVRAMLHTCSLVEDNKAAAKVGIKEEPRQAQPEKQAEPGHQQPKEQELERIAWVPQLGACLQLSLPAHAATPSASSSAAHKAATDSLEQTAGAGAKPDIPPAVLCCAVLHRFCP